MSENWEERHHYPLQNQPKPELNFDKDIREALTRFKLHKILKMCNFNQDRLKSAASEGDAEATERYLKLQMKLYEARDKLAKASGTVVLK